MEELFVGHAAPQEIGEARGEFEVVEAAGGLDAEEEARRDEDGFERELHALIDGVALPLLLYERHEFVDFVVGDGASISAAGEVGEIGAGAGEGVMAGCVAAAENAGGSFRKWRRDAGLYGPRISTWLRSGGEGGSCMSGGISMGGPSGANSTESRGLPRPRRSEFRRAPVSRHPGRDSGGGNAID